MVFPLHEKILGELIIGGVSDNISEDVAMNLVIKFKQLLAEEINCLPLSGILLFLYY